MLVTVEVHQLTWWVTRSTGLVAWVLVTASIVWGLMLSSRIVRGRGIAPWLLDLHRYLGTLALVFTAFHVVSLLFDTFVGFTVKDLLVPYSTSWRPGAVALGIVAMYLVLAIQVTSWLKRRIPRRLWRSVHMTSFLVFASATVHGALGGTDRTNRLLQWLALTAVVLVVFMIVYRVISIGEVRTVQPSAPAPPPLLLRGTSTPRALASGATRPPDLRAVGLRRVPLSLDPGEVPTEPVPITAPPEPEPAPVGAAGPDPATVSDDQAARLAKLRARRR